MVENREQIQGQLPPKVKAGDNGGRRHLLSEWPTFKGLLLFPATAAWSSRPCSFTARFDIARVYGRSGLRGFGARRANPDFNVVCVAVTAINHRDAA